MLYALTLCIGLAMGVLMKGKLSNIFKIKFQKIWLLLAAFVIQTFSRLAGIKGFAFSAQYSLLIQFAVFGLLFMGLWFNRRYIGLIIIGLGTFLNALVMMANGGKMPVSLELVKKSGLNSMIDMLQSGADGKHILIDSGTKLAFLSDVIYVPGVLGAGMNIISLGDVTVALGILFLSLQAVTGFRVHDATQSSRKGNEINLMEE